MLVKIELIDGPNLISAGATETYVAALKAGRRLAPLYCKTRYGSDRLLLVDGANRLAAAKRQGLTGGRSRDPMTNRPINDKVLAALVALGAIAASSDDEFIGPFGNHVLGQINEPDLRACIAVYFGS